MACICVRRNSRNRYILLISVFVLMSQGNRDLNNHSALTRRYFAAPTVHLHNAAHISESLGFNSNRHHLSNYLSFA